MENENKENKYYNENIKKAIYKHRENNRPAYNERQRNYYAKLSEDEEWRTCFNERCREANRKYREKKRLENPPKARGRPRKTIPVLIPPILERND
tara:strand:- start:208 stop:492 length:285 start_codon:yes stop_codon:yes gene_type:complete